MELNNLEKILAKLPQAELSVSADFALRQKLQDTPRQKVKSLQSATFSP